MGESSNRLPVDALLAPAATALGALRAGLDLLAVLPRLVSSLERVATFGELLERVAVPLEQIAEFQATLDQIGGFGDTLNELTEIRAVLDQLVPFIPALSDSIAGLERSAGQLTAAAQPLGRAVQRLPVIGGRKAAAAAAAAAGSAVELSREEH